MGLGVGFGHLSLRRYYPDQVQGVAPLRRSINICKQALSADFATSGDGGTLSPSWAPPGILKLSGAGWFVNARGVLKGVSNR